MNTRIHWDSEKFLSGWATTGFSIISEVHSMVLRESVNLGICQYWNYIEIYCKMTEEWHVQYFRKNNYGIIEVLRWYLPGRDWWKHEKLQDNQSRGRIRNKDLSSTSQESRRLANPPGYNARIRTLHGNTTRSSVCTKKRIREHFIGFLFGGWHHTLVSSLVL
jgi:hypothetical protein